MKTRRLNLIYKGLFTIANIEEEFIAGVLHQGGIEKKILVMLPVQST